MNKPLMYASLRAGWTTLFICALATGCGGEKDPILGTGIAVARPTVTASTPANSATNISIDTAAFTATFSEPMALPASGSTFTLSCAAPCRAPTGTVALDGTNRTLTYTLTNSPLRPLTLYTATVSGATSIETGLTLASPFVWSFTTASSAGSSQDAEAPEVEVTIPATASPTPTSGVPINDALVAVFSEAMDPATLTNTSFTVTCLAPCVSPTGTVTYVAANRAAIFEPAAALSASTTYTARITTAATDVIGNPLSGNQDPLAAASDYVWTFVTAITPDSTRPIVTLTNPITTTPGPTPGVAANTGITALFSEQMLPGTINASSFTLTCAAPCTSPTGSVSYGINSRTAVFTPSTPLAVGATYTATITSAALDLASNALAGDLTALPAASNYVWTFTTQAPDAIQPTVTTTNPLNGAVGVCINKTISATFSEPMDPLTITNLTFTLATTAGVAVTGVVAYDPLTRIATLNPVGNLTGTPATNYTATIKSGTTGVKDLAGNTLAVDNVTTFTTSALTCAAAPALGAAARFGSFGGNATLTNDGLDTVIIGDVGVNSSSPSITGFRDTGGNVYTITGDNNGLVNGLVYTQTDPPLSVPGAAVTQARIDALLAFNSISPASIPGGINVANIAQCPSCGGLADGADELAGRTLPPGVYLSAQGTYDIGGLTRTTADLTLDAGGDIDAVWIFQTTPVTGTLNVGLTGPGTPATPIHVQLINGAQPKNVFWYVPAGATIGTGSTMVGTMLADASITMSTTGGSPPTAVLTTLEGRAIALTAAVTMTNTFVNVPAP